MPAEFVVEKSLDALASRKLIVIPGWRYKLVVFFGRRIPVWLRLKLETKSPHTKTRV
jgi:short-subunit dehydrogenase